MCARFAQQVSARAYAARYGVLGEVDDIANGPAIRNVAPTDRAFVLRRHPKLGDLHLSPLRWGLVPVWSKDASRAARLINARSESVAETASFKSAWAKGRRCVVPADGFYEWATREGRKQPFLFTRKDGAPLAFAGLWEGWKDPATGDWLRTFTLLTCAANALMAPIHDRMPVILADADIAAYLTEPDPRQLLLPFPAAEMELRPVDAAAAMPGAPAPLPWQD